MVPVTASSFVYSTSVNAIASRVKREQELTSVIDFKSRIAARQAAWIARRRDLHRHPELGFPKSGAPPGSSPRN